MEKGVEIINAKFLNVVEDTLSMGYLLTALLATQIHYVQFGKLSKWCPDLHFHKLSSEPGTLILITGKFTEWARSH